MKGNASQRFAPRQPLKFPEFKNLRKVQYLVQYFLKKCWLFIMRGHVT